MNVVIRQHEGGYLTLRYEGTPYVELVAPGEDPQFALEKLARRVKRLTSV